MRAYRLPANPSLEQLRKQAKELRDLVRAGHPDAVKLARDLHPRWAGASGFTLADAQLVVARRHDFPSWRRLREHLDLFGRYSRSQQRCPADGADPVHELLRLACLTYCHSWHCGAGEEPDDLHRQHAARRLLATRPRLSSATIHTAAAVGDVAAARSLLAENPSLANQEGGPHRWPPLLYLTFSRLDSTAAGHSTLEVARLLLAHGADPNAGYLPDGQTPPVTALSGAFRGRRDPVNQPAHQHCLPLARLLLEAGADPNDEQALRNLCGCHPHDDTGLPLLLEHGLGRRSTDPWRARLRHRRFSPAELVQAELRYAAQWNLPGRVELLLRRCAEAGIDLDAVENGESREHVPFPTAYETAVMHGNTEVADLLTAAGARTSTLDPTREFVAACLRTDRLTVRRLLAADPGLAERAARGAPGVPEPVHVAIALGRPEAVALAVSLGFPIDEDWCGWGPPLHTAALSGQLDIVRLLVELGADPTAEAPSDSRAEFIPQDRTATGWARYNQHHEVVAYLSNLTSA